jgi:hypothetical protein
MYISSAGRIAMKVTETPASVPSSAARGVIHGIAGLDRDRQHDHEGDDEHMRHGDARRQRADVGATGLLRQFVGEEGVIEGGETHHQAERRQDAAEHQ